MAILHYYAGPATVQVKGRDSAGVLHTTFIDIGINRDAIPIIVQPRFLDVPSDDWGGEDGVPADTQALGAIATIQLSLTKFDLAECDKLFNGYYIDDGSGMVAGTFLEFGSLLRQENYMFQLTLDSQTAAGARANTQEARNAVFDYCFIRNGGATGHGTRYSSYDFQIEAWMDAPSTRKLYEVTYA